MKTFWYISLLFIFITTKSWCQNPDSIKISITWENVQVSHAIQEISEIYSIPFSYQSNHEGLNKNVSGIFKNKPLSLVLDYLLENTGLQHKVYSGQVILFVPKTDLPSKLIIEGKLCRAGSYEPIPYAGIELKQARKGTISDNRGYFRMEIEYSYLKDTLLVSSLNYFPQRIPVKTFNMQGLHTFFLNERIIEMQGFEVIGAKGKTERLGNHRLFSQGSFYLDTHGQQTALYIENEEKSAGSLLSVSVYLSKKGNTDAPFRIHVYRRDSITGKPCDELLPEMVILKPNKGKGWYDVNLSRFKIYFPENGLFVAIEGVFPGDYNFTYDNDSQASENSNDDSDDDFEGETISYGQQIGYSGGSNNRTWHYSFDGNWFQLKKKHFNAMISAEFKINKTKVKRGFLGLFGRKKLET
jgi:hypothetical protein